MFPLNIYFQYLKVEDKFTGYRDENLESMVGTIRVYFEILLKESTFTLNDIYRIS